MNLDLKEILDLLMILMEQIKIPATLIALLALFLPTYFSLRTLRELRSDRIQRGKPFLVFESGQFELAMKKGNLQTLSALYPAWVPNKIETLLPEDAEILYSPNKQDYGKLKNYGTGPALFVNVHWTATDAFVKPSLEGQKLRQKLYRKDLNMTLSSPFNIIPNRFATITRLPTFILADYAEDIQQVKGVLEIEYQDIFGQKHKTHQRFDMFTEYGTHSIKIIVEFSDLVYDKKTIKSLAAYKK